MKMDAVHESLENFIVDYCEYLPKEIPRLTEIPEPIDFLNNHVYPSCPFIIRPPGGFFSNITEEWGKSTYDIRMPMKGRIVTVAATPDGLADSIVDDKFMVPEERRMKFTDFMKHIEEPPRWPDITKLNLYVQKQNNNFFDEFSPLLPFLCNDVPWATKAFGRRPDATNFWVGSSQSFTSMHKDHYENIYFVITGCKTFRIFPPISIAWMPYKKCPIYQWYFDDFRWLKKDLKAEIDWIRTDLQPDNPQKLKMMNLTKSYTVSILPGEALYLPAMWFHEVSQINKTVAMNFWYDMSYAVNFPYYCLVKTLGKLSSPRKDASIDTQSELEEGLLNDILPRITPKHILLLKKK